MLCQFLSDLLARARKKMDPNKSAVFAYDRLPAHLDLGIPAPYIHSLCFPPLEILEKVSSCLKPTPKADISRLEIQICTCVTGVKAKP